MTAIFGICHKDGVINQGDLLSLADTMKTWAPDHVDYWIEGSVALGSRLLRTTPESLNEVQPFLHKESGLVVVADARLDNRDELLSALRVQNLRISDSELILESYKRWGTGCPNHLLGDFAFAIWDPREKSLLCARDHLGAKTLFYVCDGRNFYFSSDTEALTRLPAISSAMHESVIATLFVQQLYEPCGRDTAFKSVFRLKPGEIVQFQEGNLFHSRYWKPEPLEELHCAKESEYFEAFEEVFDNAVNCRLRSARMPAALVSGGLDSAAIIGACGKIFGNEPSTQHLATYSVIDDKPEHCIESRCIDLLTQKAWLRPAFLRVPSFTGISDKAELMQVAWEKPQPSDNSILLVQMLMRAAVRDGHNTILSGACGDIAQWNETRYISPLLQRGHWKSAWRESRLASDHHNYLRHKGATRILLENAYQCLPSSFRLLVSRARRGRPRYYDVLTPEYIERLGLDQLIRQIETERNQQSGRSFQERYLSALEEVTSTLGAEYRIAARSGIEARDPWADRRVLEFFQKIPQEYASRKGWTKYVARNAYVNQIPESVRYRVGKEHLGFNFHHQATLGLGQSLEYLISDSLFRITDKLQTNRISDAIHKMHKGDYGESYMLFELMTIIGWLKSFENH